MRRSVDVCIPSFHRCHPSEPFRRTNIFAICLNIRTMIEKRPYSSNFPLPATMCRSVRSSSSSAFRSAPCSSHVSKSREMPRAGSINSGQYCSSSVALQGGSECPFTQSRKRITSNISTAPHERQTSTLATPHDSPVHRHSQQPNFTDRHLF